MQQTQVADSKKSVQKYYVEREELNLAADPVVSYMSQEDIEKLISKNQQAMEKAAKDLDFLEAARLRDEILELKKLKQKGWYTIRSCLKIPNPKRQAPIKFQGPNFRDKTTIGRFRNFGIWNLIGI